MSPSLAWGNPRNPSPAPWPTVWPNPLSPHLASAPVWPPTPVWPTPHPIWSHLYTPFHLAPNPIWPTLHPHLALSLSGPIPSPHLAPAPIWPQSLAPTWPLLLSGPSHPHLAPAPICPKPPGPTFDHYSIWFHTPSHIAAAPIWPTPCVTSGLCSCLVTPDPPPSDLSPPSGPLPSTSPHVYFNVHFNLTSHGLKPPHMLLFYAKILFFTSHGKIPKIVVFINKVLCES